MKISRSLSQAADRLPVLWLIDPLLGKDLETNNEYSRCYAIGE
jgi:hypothetical protein